MSINPAYAGVDKALEFTLLHRSQWQGIKGAPTHQLLSVNLPEFFESVGVGINLVNYSYGINRYYDVSVPASYVLRLGEYKLKLGSSVHLKSYNEDFSKDLISIDSRKLDNLIPVSNVNGNFINFGLGMYLSGKFSFLGVSTQSLIKDIFLSENGIVIPNFRTVDVMAGYNFEYSEDFSVLSQAMIRVSNQYHTTIDFNSMIRFNKGISLGGGLRIGKPVFNSISFNAGFHVKQGFFGIAYDYPVSGLRGVQLGTYEVAGHYKFSIKRSGYEGFNPRFF
jgi:type IX secretion system PorP/SprF family membrane protein